MNKITSMHRSRLRFFAYTLMMVITIIGCMRNGRNLPVKNVSGKAKIGKTHNDGHDSSEKHMSAINQSADNLLHLDDVPKFRHGRSQQEILDDVQWRGNFEMGTVYNGKTVIALSYGLWGGPYSDGGTSIWALFVDGSFEKFVPWPSWGPSAIKVGDFDRLVRALDLEPINFEVLQRKHASSPRATVPSDPGLTAVAKTLGPGLTVAHERDLKANAAVRDQFNAARLKFGMTELEVESTFDSKPIMSGIVDAGSFLVFGSEKTYDALPELHYSNVLTLFVDGRLCGIYSGVSVPGGSQLADKLRETFVDIPQ